MYIDPFRSPVNYEGTATTVEQRVTLEAQHITKLINTGANAITFSFDYSISADDNPFGLARTYDLLVNLRAIYVAHCAMGAGTHTTADVVNNNPIAIASESLSNMLAAFISLKAKYNAHDNETGTYHPAAGTAHQIAAADPTTLPGLITGINEMRSDLIDHMADAVAHAVVDTTNIITVAAAYNGAITLVQNETYEQVDLAFTDLYFKTATSTSDFKFRGEKP